MERIFSLNELITICNVLSISNEDLKAEIVVRILSCLCDLKVLEDSIVRESKGEVTDDEDQTLHTPHSSGRLKFQQTDTRLNFPSWKSLLSQSILMM